MPNEKLRVGLTADERQQLEEVCRKQTVGMAKLRRARVLLLSDEKHAEGRRRDWALSQNCGIGKLVDL